MRELKNQRPLSPAFNENLRDAFRRETELLFESIVREDRSVVDLLNADYTFVDQRLAAHYGMPGVHGAQFRRVAIQDDARRGLLGQSSFLLVTSVANRTSPVARGKWILENILGFARATASAERASAQRGRRHSATHFATPAHGRASQESNLRGVPQNHGPDRIFARQFRPDRDLA